MFLSKEDFNTHLYPEIIDTISREDDLILDDAIEAAIGEAESYLGRFDTDALFEATDDDRDKTLLLYVKDITVWHFIAVCNADTDIDMRESRYNKAINWLKNIQSGKVSPKGWALTSVENADQSFLVTSNPRRTTNY